jgi:hypothetical protein
VRWQRFLALEEAAYQKAVALVATKQGQARTETVRALLYRPSRGDADVVKPGAGLPDAEVIAAFERLPADQQYQMLSTWWGRIRLPLIAGAIEKLLAQPDLKHQLLRDTALQRLHEVDPDAAKPWILGEIRRPHVDSEMFTVHGTTLAVLPDKTLPQFDEILVSRLGQPESRTAELDAELIGRYSTDRILPRVKLIYESMPNRKDCRIADGLSSYFLRVDLDYGLKHATDALSLCMEQTFKTLQRIGRSADVQPALIAQLNGNDLWAARAAAEALARYGDGQAQKAMWARLAAFHGQWVDRAKELQNPLGMSREASDAQGFQYGLVEALGRAQAWVLTDEQVAQLEDLTIGSERENVARWRWSSPLPLDLWAFDNVRATINNQYTVVGLASLRAKLGQYPAGRVSF